MPKNQKQSEGSKVQKMSKGTKIALLFSLSLHIILFIAMQSTSVYSGIYSIKKWIPIDIMNVPPDSSILPQMFSKNIEVIERKWTPVEREASINREISPRELSPREILPRETMAKIENTTRLDVPSVNPNVPSDISLPSSASFKSPTGLDSGLYSQGSKIGKNSGANMAGKRGKINDSAKIIPTPQRKIATTNSSVSEKLEVYKDAEMPFVEGLKAFGSHIANTKTAKKVDITFILDISESMQDNTASIKRHMYKLIDNIKEANLDFTLGVVTFHYNKLFDWLGTEIDITEQTHDIEEIRIVLDNIKVSGGERQLDALMKSFSKVRFRSGAGRHFIFITDEYVKGTYSISDVLREAKRSKVVVDVLGKDEPFQRSIAEQTGGIWMPIEVADMN